jgi:hypothetical protein
MAGIDDAVIEHFCDVGKLTLCQIWADSGRGREGTMVFARTHLQDRARRGEAAAAADHRQAARRAPRDRAAQAGSRNARRVSYQVFWTAQAAGTMAI